MQKYIKYTLKALAAAALFFVFTWYVALPGAYRCMEPRLAMPVSSFSVRSDSCGNGEFGAKRKNGKTHQGLDLKAEIKSPVYASKSGWAMVDTSDPEGYGKMVIINHPGLYQTRSAHLSKVNIRPFQWVKQGRIIGFVGKTGNAGARGIAPHLHFEIRRRGKALDPEKFLIRRRKP
jgi:murein DD-endopeptidase MepM/ murein hydrolase activator NlpD